jgi:hypothetical protein
MTWPRYAGLRGQTAWPGRCPGFPHWGPAPLSNRARAQRSEGSSQRGTALGIRSLSRATKSSGFSPRASLSVFHEDGAVADPEDGAPSRPKSKQPYSRASVEGQPTGSWGRSWEPCRQGSGSHNLGRVEGSPTSVQSQVPKPLQCASTPPLLIEESEAVEGIRCVRCIPVQHHRH